MPDFTEELDDLETVLTETTKELDNSCKFELHCLVLAMKKFISIYEAKILSEKKLNKLKAKLSMEDSDEDSCDDCYS